MGGSAAGSAVSLEGRRILVVEDEYMIAEEIAELLADARAETLGPVPTVKDAMKLIASEPQIDLALLDVNLHNEAVWPVVDALLERNVPLVLATGYDAGAIPPAYAHLLRREKPTNWQELTHVLAEALSPDRGTPA